MLPEKAAEVVETAVQKDETTQIVDESTADTQQSEGAEAQKEEQPGDGKAFSQEEVDKIVRKRLARESRRLSKVAEIEAENRILKQRIEASKPAAKTPEGAPKVDDFEDYDGYVQALTDWKVEQKLKTFRSENEAQKLERESQERAEATREKLLQVADEYDDFDDVVFNPELEVTERMAEVIAESSIGGHLAYYLGSNIDVAAKIARMSPLAQTREIIALEAKLSKPPKPTNAPAPIAPTGNKTSASKDPKDMTAKEFAEWRKQYLSRR